MAGALHITDFDSALINQLVVAAKGGQKGSVERKAGSRKGARCGIRYAKNTGGATRASRASWIHYLVALRRVCD